LVSSENISQIYLLGLSKFTSEREMIVKGWRQVVGKGERSGWERRGKWLGKEKVVVGKGDGSGCERRGSGWERRKKWLGKERGLGKEMKWLGKEK